MALTNAEKQARWRGRHMVVLTEDARTIAEKLIDMADQAKLKRIAKYKAPGSRPDGEGGRAGADWLCWRARWPTDPCASA